jgi:hypothetical protein
MHKSGVLFRKQAVILRGMAEVFVSKMPSGRSNAHIDAHKTPHTFSEKGTVFSFVPIAFSGSTFSYW